MKGYTAKPLLLPEVNTLGELFAVMETEKDQAPKPERWGRTSIGPYCSVSGHATGYQSLWVRPNAQVLKAIKENMLPDASHTLHFKCVIRDDGSCLVTCDYDQILGGRYLTLIPATELDRFGWKADE